MQASILTTSAGITAAVRQAGMDFTDQMQAGTLTAADIGGMTPQDFLDAIMRAMGILQAQAGSGMVPGTGDLNAAEQSLERLAGNRLEASCWLI